MTCIKCNAENNENARFCSSCGAKLEEAAPMVEDTPVVEAAPMVEDIPEVEEIPALEDLPLVEEVIEPESASESQAKKAAAFADKLPKNVKAPDTKKLITLGVAVVALVAIVAIVSAIGGMFSGGGGGKIVEAKNSINVFYSPEEDESYIMIDDTVLDVTIGEYAYLRATTSGDVSLYSSIEDLYVLTSDKSLVKIKDTYFSMPSRNGKSIAYTEEDGDLYLYDVATASSTRVAKDIGYYDFVLSPDGGSLAYIKDNTLYVLVGDKETKIDTKLDRILTISNSGKHIFYIRNGDLYLANAGKVEPQKIADDYDFISVTNAERTEKLFGTEDGMFHVNSKGELIDLDFSCDSIWRVCPVKAYDITGSLLGAYYVADGEKLYYIDSKGVSERISKRAENVMMLDNGDVYFLESDAIYKVEAGKTEAVEIADDAEYFQVTPNGKTIYFVDEDGDLYVVSGKNDPSRISDDIYSISMTHDGILLVLDYDDTLYFCKNGKDLEKISRDVISVQTNATVSYYYTGDSDESDVYVAKSGTEFTKLLEDVYCY